MSIPTQDYRANKEKICEVCEQIFSEFGDDDVITIDGKSCQEVSDILSKAIKETTELKNVDVTKYVYIVSSNGKTLIKR